MGLHVSWERRVERMGNEVRKSWPLQGCWGQHPLGGTGRARTLFVSRKSVASRLKVGGARMDVGGKQECENVETVQLSRAPPASRFGLLLFRPNGHFSCVLRSDE